MTLQRSEFTSTDVDDVRALLTEAYADGLVIGPTEEGGFRYEQATVSDGVLTISTVRLGGSLVASMRGSRDVLFSEVGVGRYEWRSGGVRGDQRRPLVLPAAHELHVDLTSPRATMVQIDARTVDRWLAIYGGLTTSPALLHRAASGTEAVRDAIRFCAGLLRSEALEHELVRSNLIDLLLSMTAHGLIADPIPEEQRGAPAALRRAQEFLREHAAEPVSVAEAAEAARLSVRGLQNQFQRTLGVTPGQYLRQVRLEAVHAELVAAREDATPATVGEVARRWGFAHLGRFATYYAGAYGESPSRTLRIAPEADGA